MKEMKRMNVVKQFLLMSVLMLFTAVLAAQTKNNQDNNKQIVDKEKKEELKRDAEAAKSAFIENSQNLKDLLDTAVGYVIFPNVGAGAYILGGAAGNGVLYENGEVQGFAELRQLDIGLQIGGQAYRQAILFQTQDELE
jgi:lipid-binding SYLF domain-containing protein